MAIRGSGGRSYMRRTRQNAARGGMNLSADYRAGWIQKAPRTDAGLMGGKQLPRVMNSKIGGGAAGGAKVTFRS